MDNIVQNTKRPVLFLGVGILNTALDFTFYTLLVTFVFIDTSQIALAGIVSGTFALFSAFLSHSLITWKGSKISIRSIVLFILFTGFGMWIIRPLILSSAITLAPLYAWLHSILNGLGLEFSLGFVASTVAFGIMTAVLLVYNYVVYNYIVFRSR